MLPPSGHGLNLRLAAFFWLAFIQQSSGQVKTCKRSCQDPNSEGLQAGEKVGATSRCFKARLTSRSVVYRCYRVDCEGADGSHYNIIVGINDTSRCTTPGEFITFANWKGSVACEARTHVCNANGGVKAGFQEQRRVNISQSLITEHGAAAASTLLSKYDEGTFNPHTPAEGGLSGQYLVRKTDASCNLGSWTAGLKSDALGLLGVTSFQGVGTAKLLSAVQQTACAGYIEQDVSIHTDSTPWGIDSIDGALDGQYARNYEGIGVEVYVTDTGIDSDHGELVGRVAAGQDFTDDQPPSTEDTGGHGTHCAGSIAGTNIGVAPLATVVPLKVFNNAGSGQGGWLMASMDWLLLRRRDYNGPMVVSSSLGTTKHELINQAFGRLVTAGITVVVAAGNEDSDADLFSPASEPSVITVGAIDQSTQPASFSNYGDVVDIWAPGVGIKSAKTGGGLVLMSGTSMAAPHVAGAAALVLGANPSWLPARVRQELLSCAIVVSGGVKGSTGKVLSTRATTGSQSCILANAASSPSPSPPSEGDGGSGAAAVIVVLVVLVLLVLLALLAYFLWKRQACKERCMSLPMAMQRPNKKGSEPAKQPEPVGQTAAKPAAPTAPGGSRWQGLWRPAPAREKAAVAASAERAERTPEQLAGPDWEAFNQAQPRVAEAIQQAQAMLGSTTLFENGCEDPFQALRRGLRSCPAEGPGSLDSVPAKADVWDFVLLVGAKRKFLRSQVAEVCHLLEQRPSWLQSLQANPDLRRRRGELP